MQFDAQLITLSFSMLSKKIQKRIKDSCFDKDVGKMGYCGATQLSESLLFIKFT